MRSNHFEKVHNWRESLLLIELSPFDVRNLRSVLATPLHYHVLSAHIKRELAMSHVSGMLKKKCFFILHVSGMLEKKCVFPCVWYA